MKPVRFALGFAATALLSAVVWGQASSTPAPATNADHGMVFVPTQDPGVARAVLIDRPEIRVLRVELQPGATRSIHTHDDVQYHLFSVVEGTMGVTVGSDDPVEAHVGRTFFFKPGTKHGFKNLGTTKAAAMEIFVRQSTVKSAKDQQSIPLEEVLAALESASRAAR